MPEIVAGLLWIALGGALGGPARYFVSGLVGRRFGETFPWGTMAANVTGCLLMGALAATVSLNGMALSSPGWQIAGIGFLGSYTTVSSFSRETLALARDGQSAGAGWNIVLSFGLCLAAVALGYAAANGILA
jgi:fluoride exporter